MLKAKSRQRSGAEAKPESSRGDDAVVHAVNGISNHSDSDEPISDGKCAMRAFHESPGSFLKAAGITYSRWVLQWTLAAQYAACWCCVCALQAGWMQLSCVWKSALQQQHCISPCSQ